MNLQNIQILCLLLDSFIMLAPWRIVTKAVDRIGYAAGRGLARSLGIVAVLKPFEAHNTAEFTMLPQRDATSVNWVMRGPAPFLSKMMQVFMNMDEMIGKDFEAGLVNLKGLVEK